MTLPIVVTVSTEDVNRCKEFAAEMGGLNQAHEFNNSQTNSRRASEVTRDILIGKVAEVAVYQLLTASGAKLGAPDFTVIGANARDEHDLVSAVNGYSLSIKATEKGRFLFIHEGQVRWNRANIYVVCRTEMDGDIPTGKVTVLAFAGFNDLFNKDAFAKWTAGEAPFDAGICGSLSGFVRAGERSPAGNFPMQSTNVYADSGSLRKDLQQVVDALNRPRTS